MVSDRFDALTKVVGRRATRRRVLRGVLSSALAGGVVTLAGRRPVQAVPACLGAGHPCQGNQECCPGLVCRVTGPGNVKRCAAPVAG
jgi:Ion channel inhibitory toxin